MNISVIIPVYNAAPFVAKAVRSALRQTEVKEVILIEDASKDESLVICQRLELEDSRVFLYQHPDLQNHGAGASRNLGIEKSTCPYIAFLDADDYYLENRFLKTREVLEKNPEADGVYEAIQRAFSNPAMKKKYKEVYKDNELITMDEGISSEELFEAFLIGEKGWFSIDGLLIKRSLLKNTGVFDAALRQTQDTDFMLRLCLFGKLIPGELKKPVTIAYVHGDNRILETSKSILYRHLLFKKWFAKVPNSNWSPRLNRHIIRGMLYSHPVIFKYKNSSTLRIPLKVIYLLSYFIKQPRIIAKIL